MREVVGEENFDDDSIKVDECSRTLRGGRCRLLSRLILSVKDGRRWKGSTKTEGRILGNLVSREVDEVALVRYFNNWTVRLVKSLKALRFLHQV